MYTTVYQDVGLAAVHYSCVHQGAVTIELFVHGGFHDDPQQLPQNALTADGMAASVELLEGGCSRHITVLVRGSSHESTSWRSLRVLSMSLAAVCGCGRVLAGPSSAQATYRFGLTLLLLLVGGLRCWPHVCTTRPARPS